MKYILGVLKGNCGIEYTVFTISSCVDQSKTMFGWEDPKGYGFTNESLQYVLEYLREAKGTSI